MDNIIINYLYHYSMNQEEKNKWIELLKISAFIVGALIVVVEVLRLIFITG